MELVLQLYFHSLKHWFPNSIFWVAGTGANSAFFIGYGTGSPIIFSYTMGIFEQNEYIPHGNDLVPYENTFTPMGNEFIPTLCWNLHKPKLPKIKTFLMETSFPYFRVKLSCVCLMFAYRKKLPKVTQR